MRRQFTIALVLFEAFLFNVFIPAHTRGIIELPGARSGHSCCAPSQDSQKKRSGDGKRAENCAVCAFAARVVSPPPIEFAPEPAGVVDLRPAPAAQQLLAAPFPLPYFGRAPPAAV